MPEIVNFPNTRTEIREQASEWIAKMQSGQLSDEEQAQLKAWVAQSRNHENELKMMAENWDRLHTIGKKHLAVSSRSSNAENNRESTNTWVNFALKAAAAISFLALIPLVYFLSFHPNSKFETNGVFVTKVGAQKTINLSDGSVVFLNTNSELLVNYNENSRNLTLLRGEASFDVAKDKLYPFVVKAGNGDVQALGTSFAVRLNGEKVDVLVSHGTVRVRASDANIRPNAKEERPAKHKEKPSNAEESVIARAGNRVVFEKHKVESVTVETQETLDRELYWKKGFLDFNQIPLAQVVSEVARYTDYKIVISDSTLEHLTVGGYYPIDNIETIFETLEMNFNLEVTELDDNTFVIKKQYKS